MKLYEAIRTFDVPSGDRDYNYVLFVYKGALILEYEDVPIPCFQTTLFEHIDSRDMQPLMHNLEQVELPDVENILRYVSHHNYKCDVTYAKLNRDSRGFPI